jgi:ubiquinol-cytochrome c reductase cytochrome c subunit
MPRGGYAPKIRGVDPRHVYQAMLTGPQAMPTFSNGNIPSDDKKAIIAYLDSLDGSPNFGGFTFGSLGPVSEGIIAWLIGIGGLVGFAIWIAAHTTRSSSTPRSGSEKDRAEA